MASIFRRHKPNIWRHAGKVVTLIIATISSSIVYIVLCFQLVDMPRLGLVESLPRTIIWLTMSFLTWVPSAFSLVLSLCVIMAGHYVECRYLKTSVHDDYLKCIPSGEALYDLHAVFLRVVETSETWSKAVAWCLGSSSMCFFFMLITYVTDGLAFSVIPPMSIMLPCLWIPAFACGSVTARFVHIYISVNTRSPLLLPETDEKNYNKSYLRRRSVSVREEVVPQEGEGDEEEGGEAAATPQWNRLTGAALMKYEDEHDKLLELCKHLEDIFGIRVMGLKVTASQILQIATFYGTGATLIIQNSAAWQAS